MNEDLKQTIKRFLPAPLLLLTRYFKPQRRFDRRFSVDTNGIIEPEELHVEDSRDASGYEPTELATFTRIMSDLPLDYERFVFVDMGSGKGAVILYASAFPFKRIVGVEFSPPLHRIANQNISSYHIEKMKCKDVTSLCLDVADYQLPTDPTVLYLFNPFKGRALAKVIANTWRSLKKHPRDLAVIYYHPKCRHSAWDRAFFLKQVRREQDHTIYRSRC